MEKKAKSWSQEIISFALMLTISFIVVFLFTQFIAKPVRVEGSSMYPTLKDNDIAFSSLMSLDKIERFDIVVVYLEDQDKYIVKRVIGLPNETVKVVDDVLYINDVETSQDFLDPDYVVSQSYRGIFTYDIEPVTLKENEYYLMGDNRPNSQDSRYYGPFTKDEIVSKDLLIFFPFNRIGVK